MAAHCGEHTKHVFDSACLHDTRVHLGSEGFVCANARSIITPIYRFKSFCEVGKL